MPSSCMFHGACPYLALASCENQAGRDVGSMQQKHEGSASPFLDLPLVSIVPYLVARREVGAAQE